MNCKTVQANAGGLGRASVTQPLVLGEWREARKKGTVASSVWNLSKGPAAGETENSASSTGASIDSLARPYECNFEH